MVARTRLNVTFYAHCLSGCSHNLQVNFEACTKDRMTQAAMLPSGTDWVRNVCILYCILDYPGTGGGGGKISSVLPRVLHEISRLLSVISLRPLFSER